jgi:hypothetical protein
VKLSANFPYTTYVLAFDDEMVGDALGESYGKGGSEAGQHFLEKIIQVPLYLPPADNDTLREMAFEGVEAALKLADIPISETLKHEFPYRFIEGLQPGLVTPRQVVRYGNALAFAMPLTKGEVDPLDQLLVEGVRVFYPKLYRVIRDNPECVLLGASDRIDETEKKRLRSVLESGLDGLEPEARAGGLKLLQGLFPRVEGIFRNMGYASSWDTEWTRNKKISSRHYFSRYFTYAIGRGDVADRAVDALLEIADRSDQASVDAALAELVSSPTASRVIDKLSLREDRVSTTAAHRLVLALARNGGSYPGGQGMAMFSAPELRAAILVEKLILRVEPGKRAGVAEAVMKVAEPLTFALECLRWIRTDEESAQQGQAVLNAGDERKVAAVLVDRIRTAAAQNPPYTEVRGAASSMLWVWNHYGPEGECREYLRKRFAANPSEITQFLSAFSGTAWSGSSGVPRPGDLDRSNYDSICKLVSPSELADRLVATYGAELKIDEYERLSDRPVDIRLASQFVYVHRHITAPPEEKENGALVKPTAETGRVEPGRVERGFVEAPANARTEEPKRGGRRKPRKR